MIYCYVCSPYKGNLFKRIRNKMYARQLTKKAINLGFVPITPHLYITEVLNDNKREERKLGTELSLKLLELCDVIIIGGKYGISEGMAAEIEFAKKTEKIIGKGLIWWII